MSKLFLIVLLIILKAVMFLIPIQQVGASIQNDQKLQPSNTLLTQISPFIQEITNNITSHNPGAEPDPDKIKQILQGIGIQIGETSDTMAIQAMSEIASEVDVDPKGPLAQSLISLGEAVNDRTLLPLVSQIQENADRGYSVVDSIIDTAASLVASFATDDTLELSTADILENILEITPSIDIKPDINAILNVEPSSLVIEENIPTTMVVSGALTYINNNSGIKDEVISISINSPGQDNSYKYKRNGHTDNKGLYEVDIDDVRLSKGTYETVARPLGDNYSNLSASRQFVVESRPISFNDISPYLAAGGVIIGSVSIIPRYYIRKRERNNLTQYMIKIHEEYNKFSKSKEKECLNQLNRLRMELIEILKKGKINEAHYEMLDKKISDYIDRVSKDVYKFTK
jgi:hypothetical protein